MVSWTPSSSERMFLISWSGKVWVAVLSEGRRWIWTSCLLCGLSLTAGIIFNWVKKKAIPLFFLYLHMNMQIIGAAGGVRLTVRIKQKQLLQLCTLVHGHNLPIRRRGQEDQKASRTHARGSVSKTTQIKHRKATGCLEETVLSCHSWVLLKVL